MPVLGKLLLLFFEIILLYVREFLYQSEKNTEDLKKKGSHVFLPKICEQSEKNLQIQKKKSSHGVGQKLNTVYGRLQNTTEFTLNDKKAIH